MGGRKLRKRNTEELPPDVLALLESQAPASEVAEKLNVSPQAVTYHRVRLWGRTTRRGPKRQRKDVLLGLLPEVFRRLDAGESPTKVARDFGVTAPALRHHDKRRKAKESAP